MGLQVNVTDQTAPEIRIIQFSLVSLNLDIIRNCFNTCVALLVLQQLMNTAETPQSDLFL